MRILHYVKTFSPLSETFIYDFITELENQGVKNHVITQRRINIEDRPFHNTIVVNKPGRWNPGRLLRRVATAFTEEEPSAPSKKILERRFAKVIKKLNPAVIHAHFGPAGVFIAKLAEEFNIPLVVSFHGYDAFKLPKDPFWRHKYKEISRSLKRVTCVSQIMKRELTKYFPEEKINIIHVGKRLSEYKYIKPNTKVKNWLSIGRMTEKKGHFDTVNAFAKIVDLYPEQHLKIIGDGATKDELQKIIVDKKLQDSITLLGGLPHGRVIKELQKADAFILSSKTAKDGDKEGVPTVLMEAQAVGLPCVSTTHSGIPEVIPEANQFLLAEEGNVADIVAKIKLLLNLSPEELSDVSQKGRQKIGMDFSLEKEVENLHETYKRTTESSFL